MATSTNPTIVIDTPAGPNGSSNAPHHTDVDSNSTSPSSAKPRTPTIDTSAHPVASAPPARSQNDPEISGTTRSCYLCDEQNPGDFTPTTKHLETCLLCSRFFCPIHKSPSWDQVCNINHSTYYHECLDRARAQLTKMGKNNTDKRDLAEMLIAEGIYPSLGEREKAIFVTSPTSPEKARELESFRSLDAQMNGGGKGRPDLIEEKDFIDAEIAV